MSRPLSYITPYVLVALIVLGGCVALACSGADDSNERAGLAAEEAREPGRLTFRFDEGVTQADREFFPRVTEDVRRFFREEAGQVLATNVEVEVTLRGSDVKAPGYAFYDERTRLLELTIYLGHKSWQVENGQYAEEDKTILMAHELFHAMQVDLLRRGSRPDLGPGWMREGSADYAAYRYAAYAGLLDYDDLLEDLHGYITSYRVPRVGEFEYTDQDYIQSFLAVDFMTGKGGLKRLTDFYMDSGRVRWQDAFKRQFGQDAEALMKQHERRRLP